MLWTISNARNSEDHERWGYNYILPIAHHKLNAKHSPTLHCIVGGDIMENDRSMAQRLNSRQIHYRAASYLAITGQNQDGIGLSHLGVGYINQ